MFGYIHIMPIGVQTEHVITAINEPKFKPIKKIYLLHSPNDPKWEPKKCKKCDNKLIPGEKPLKDTAKDLKNRLESALPAHTKVILIEIDAFKMNSILNEIKRIVDKEYGDNPNSFNNIAVNVTGGTNMMAVASMWAAGANGISTYYILNEKFQPNLKSYLVEIATPKYKNLLEDKEKHKQILYILNKQTFHWDGITDKSKAKIVVNQDIRNSEWITEQTKKGVTRLTNLKDEMKKRGVPPNTTRNRLTQMEEAGLITIEHNAPTWSLRGSKEYPYHVYFIDQKTPLVSITAAGKTALINYKPKK